MRRLVETGPVILEIRILKCPCIFVISNLSTLGKGQGPSFKQTSIPFTQGYFVRSLVEIRTAVLKKKMFINIFWLF